LNRFAFIVHPLDASDVARKYPFARWLPSRLVEFAIRHMSARYVSKIEGIRSATGAETEGWFVGCPLTSRQLVEGDVRVSVRKIVEAGQMAADLGAGIVGLGAFTAVVGDAGVSVAEQLDIAVTTGNSYTVATAVEGTLRAAAMMGIVPGQATAAVLGATGSIGRVCAQLLAPQVGRLILVGRRPEALEQVADELRLASGAQVAAGTDVGEAVRQAEMVVAVTSAVEAVVEPEMLRPGAVVCDVARPRDVSVRVAEQRDDVLVIEGGAVSVPGDVSFNFDFGFPPGLAYACMAETMILALEGRFESYSLGRDLELARVEEISALADRHGFRLAGFRSFERAVDERTIERIRQRATRQAAS
jgi:fatty aldehyde-generating acyl-ACP reductase